MNNLDKTLLAALNYDDPGTPFDGGIQITTENGSIYTINNDSTMICTKGKRAGRIVGLAQGSVYRALGPIRLGVAVVGLRIEASRHEEGKTFITTPIVSIRGDDK